MKPKINPGAEPTPKPKTAKAQQKKSPEVVIEDKAAKSKRIAGRRTNAALTAIRLLGNCSSRSAYNYTDEQIRLMLAALERAVEELSKKFSPQAKAEKARFEFETAAPEEAEILS